MATSQSLSPEQIGAASGWQRVTATASPTSLHHTCGIASGALDCWGSNAYGQIGNGATGGGLSTPTPVGSATDWTEIAAGETSTCGIRAGMLFCWGDNQFSQLGDGAVTNHASPVQVGSASDWRSVSVAYLHACGVRSDGVYCWGNQAYGELGLGNVFSLTPRAVALP